MRVQCCDCQKSIDERKALKVNVDEPSFDIWTCEPCATRRLKSIYDGPAENVYDGENLILKRLKGTVPF